jgi:hypothetical protein
MVRVAARVDAVPRFAVAGALSEIVGWIWLMVMVTVAGALVVPFEAVKVKLSEPT